jgi:DNA-binding MarR family transcriptional regulator
MAIAGSAKQAQPDEDVVHEVMKLLPELMRAFSRRIPPHAGRQGASLAQMKALVQLAEYGPQTMGELARGLGITTPSATGLVNPLVEMGHVTRERDPNDRRVVRVRLSDDARKLAGHILDERRAEIETALEGMSPLAQANFLEGLTRLAQVYKQRGNRFRHE